MKTSKDYSLKKGIDPKEDKITLNNY